MNFRYVVSSIVTLYLLLRILKVTFRIISVV